LISRKASGLSRPNLYLDLEYGGRVRGNRWLEVQFQRLAQIVESLFLSPPLARYINVQALGNEPVSLAPDGGRKRSLYETILAQLRRKSSRPVAAAWPVVECAATTALPGAQRALSRAANKWGNSRQGWRGRGPFCACSLEKPAHLERKLLVLRSERAALGKFGKGSYSLFELMEPSQAGVAACCESSHPECRLNRDLPVGLFNAEGHASRVVLRKHPLRAALCPP
jgi:hypothetical protein